MLKLYKQIDNTLHYWETWEKEKKQQYLIGGTGLGHTDGGSIGNGTMEVGCIVVDFTIAKKENFTKICENLQNLREKKVKAATCSSNHKS